MEDERVGCQHRDSVRDIKVSRLKDEQKPCFKGCLLGEGVLGVRLTKAGEAQSGLRGERGGPWYDLEHVIMRRGETRIKKLTERGSRGVKIMEPKIFPIELVQMMASGTRVRAGDGVPGRPERGMDPW